MTKDTTFSSGFTPDNLKVLRKVLAAALAPVSEQFGITLEIGGMRYTDSTVAVKLDATTAGSNKHAEAWKKGYVGALLGIDPDALGQTFTEGFRVFRIKGLKGGRSDKVVATDLNNDKDYLFRPQTIAARFPVKKEIAA